MALWFCDLGRSLRLQLEPQGWDKPLFPSFGCWCSGPEQQDNNKECSKEIHETHRERTQSGKLHQIARYFSWINAARDIFVGLWGQWFFFSNATHEVILVMENLLSLPGLPTTLYWWSGGTSFWFLYGWLENSAWNSRIRLFHMCYAWWPNDTKWL